MTRRFCGRCGKTTEQEEVKEELVSGIHVTSFRCSRCGEEWTDLEEIKKAKKRMGELGTLKLRRKVGRVGKSLVVRIPKDIEEQMGLREGDYVELYTGKKEIRMKLKEG